MTAPDDPFAPPPEGSSYGTPPPAYGVPPTASVGTYASWGQRVGAALVDAVPGIVFSVIGQGGGALYALMTLASLAFFVWNKVREGNTGQTIGKSALGLKLVKEADGQYVGPGLAIGRGILHVVDALPCLVGFLWPLWDGKKQTFADKIVGTVVVKA